MRCDQISATDGPCPTRTDRCISICIRIATALCTSFKAGFPGIRASMRRLRRASTRFYGQPQTVPGWQSSTISMGLSRFTRFTGHDFGLWAPVVSALNPQGLGRSPSCLPVESLRESARGGRACASRHTLHAGRSGFARMGCSAARTVFLDPGACSSDSGTPAGFCRQSN